MTPRSFLIRVPEDEVLPDYLAKLAEEKGIVKAYVSGIGTFKEARLGYLSLEKQGYEMIDVREFTELLSLSGNISLSADGKPSIHLHVVLGRRDGSVVGGHLLEARVFLAELYIQELPGPVLKRQPWKYGLAVWPISED